MLHQTFEPRDLILVLALVVLEGLLSIDNALVLGLLAGRLPAKSQTKALTYGLVGSLFFRLLATCAAGWLLRWRWIKLLGGGYLLYVMAKHFIFPRKRSVQEHKPGTSHHLAFWSTVLAIELTDVVFAADSILAGIALVGPVPPGSSSWIHPKLWVIFVGGMLGVVMMRLAATGFILLLRKFPRFELSAYLLVGVVGLKLLIDWGFNAQTERVNFQSPFAIAFWVFWLSMAACVGTGFIPKSHPARPSALIRS
jgi:YkoY family integral membrane protein